MASLEFITNLKLIDGSTRTIIPTPEELPLGYMCFGIVNARASIWGNYDGRVHDLVEEGMYQIEIVQGTGQSTTVVMSQKAVTDELIEIKASIAEKVDNEINALKNDLKGWYDNRLVKVTSLAINETLNIHSKFNGIMVVWCVDSNGDIAKFTINGSKSINTEHAIIIRDKAMTDTGDDGDLAFVQRSVIQGYVSTMVRVTSCVPDSGCKLLIYTVALNHSYDKG